MLAGILYYNNKMKEIKQKLNVKDDKIKSTLLTYKLNNII